MKPIKLVADSTCDLSPELIAKYDIEVCHLIVNLDGETRFDGVDITSEELFDWSDKNNKLPTTSAPSPEMVEELFSRLCNDHDIIVIPVGSDLSSAYQLFSITAEKFKDSRITVIDGMNLSTGTGLQLVCAGEMIKKGMDYDSIIAELKLITPKVRAGFVVDDVMFLYKGGRCSALAAFGATALKLHPTLAVVNGVIKVDKKVRGDMLAATLKYGKTLEEGLNNAREDTVFITHACADQAQIDGLHEYLEGFNKFKNIYITQAGCVISSHCGRRCIGILFIEK